jgi:hypothetical protein
VSLADWRRIAARVAATLSTPLPAVMAMTWDELVQWWEAAREIDAETLSPDALSTETWASWRG